MTLPRRDPDTSSRARKIARGPKRPPQNAPDEPPRARCDDPPPPELLRGIDEFNAGEFFEQHETLELLWRATPGEIRHLYEGILQVGVGMHHLFKNHNFHGAVVKLDHGIQLLSAFPAVCHGVDVARLRRDAARARTVLLELGPEGMERFPQDLTPRVHLSGDQT